jgi:hypothetical protein
MRDHSSCRSSSWSRNLLRGKRIVVRRSWLRKDQSLTMSRGVFRILWAVKVFMIYKCAELFSISTRSNYYFTICSIYCQPEKRTFKADVWFAAGALFNDTLVDVVQLIRKSRVASTGFPFVASTFGNVYVTLSYISLKLPMQPGNERIKGKCTHVSVNYWLRCYDYWARRRALLRPISLKTWSKMAWHLLLHFRQNFKSSPYFM